MLLVRNEEFSGYREIVGKDNGHLRLLSFGMLNLAIGENYSGHTGGEEQVLILLAGDVLVEISGRSFTGTRKNVFAEKATAFYLPAQCEFKVTNTGVAGLSAALCGTPSATTYEPFVVQPDEVWDRTVGEKNWRRSVHDIVVKNAEGRVHRIIVGETFNEPGNWSSFPPHKHDHYEPGVEANMEEVYYYQLNPQEGFGLQSIYTKDNSLNETYRVQNGDTFLIPGGYHPVCAAGGYQLYYLWMMAGEIDRVMIPHDDPTHAWIKG
jgi:5-deoxy-glucuronate isomerase